MKKIYFILILFSIIWSGCSTSSIESSASVSDAKNYIDKKLARLNNEYTLLCSEKRNDQLKGKFAILGKELKFLSSCGESCSKLSYDEQIKVTNYGLRKLEDYDQLLQLYNYGTIKCW